MVSEPTFVHDSRVELYSHRHTDDFTKEGGGILTLSRCAVLHVIVLPRKEGLVGKVKNNKTIPLRSALPHIL